jgi:hypothetical protein
MWKDKDAYAIAEYLYAVTKLSHSLSTFENQYGHLGIALRGLIQYGVGGGGGGGVVGFPPPPPNTVSVLETLHTAMCM